MSVFARLCVFGLGTLFAAGACRTAPEGSSPSADEGLAPAPAGEPGCLFGADLIELEASPDFKLRKSGEESRTAPVGGDGKSKLFARAEIRSIHDGAGYVVYSSFRDEDDGGQTTGWIESIETGEVVATIDAGEIHGCRVQGLGLARSQAPQCLFGIDLAAIETSEAFAIEKQADVSRGSRVTGDDGAPKTFAVRQLRHGASGASYTLFHTYKDDEDGGATMGWIENGQGEVVAEIGDSEIYDCLVQPDGQQLGALP